MQWREYCEIRVSGHDLYRFVNALRQSPSACWEQRVAGNIFCGKVLRRDITAVRAIAAEYGMQIESRERRSVLGKLRRYRLRFGLLIGVLAGAAIIFWQSNIVETIEIQGTQTVDPQTLTAILEQEGVHRGTWIGSIDVLRCESRLTASDERIAWAGIHHTGNRLIVRISESRLNIPMLRERVPCNIIAARDAQITHVTVREGTLCHLIGDGVTKGSLLVSGVLSDEYGHTFYHHANADITGIYTQEAELTEYFELTQTVPTGRSFTRKWFRLFGLKLPLTPGRADYAECKILTSETPLDFLGFRLPCSILREYSQETVTSDQIRGEAETMLGLNAQIVRYEQYVLRDVTILERNIVYDTSESGITAHLSYRVEGEIGTPSEIYVIP